MSNSETSVELAARSAHADFSFTDKQAVSNNKTKRKPIVKNKHKLISLFSGGGGLDLGLEAAGFETIFATDIDAHSCITLQRGKDTAMETRLPFLQSAVVQQADILQLSPSEIMRTAGVRPGEVELLAGGPPCQAFSVFGRRKGINDPRGMLFHEYLRILAEIQPQAFIFENVFGLLTIHNGETFKELCERLKAPGNGICYELSVFRLNAADYGVPQYRDRVFIIGSRKGKKLGVIPPICSATAGESGLPRHRTVTDAFSGLPPLGKDLPNHTSRDHSERIIQRYSGLKFGERDPKTRINKLHPKKPSYTIIVGSDKGGGKGHVHPFEPREVSPRESARIQTFPDWWAFSGTSRHPIRQVGNAVPPVMAAMIGREIMKQFFGGEKRSLKTILSLLGQEHLFKENIDAL
jgi:DNA (cytosine-5)-methyltransferase 1